MVTSDNERFRATLRVRTPDGECATLIVTRQGWGSEGRTWLTFDGGWKATAVMTDQQTGELRGKLDEASGGAR